MTTTPSTGVLLVNLGTPEAATPSAVRSYPRQFLSDPRVVELPRLAWLPILYFLVLPFRPGKTAKKYAKIWTPDGSPLRIYHERQAQLLRGYLGQKMKSPVPVFASMRYGKPNIAYGLKELASKGCNRVLVIPMYPQYAGSATGSVEDEVNRVKVKPETRVLHDFHDHRAYAKSIAKNVNDYWFKHGRPDRLLMSFHGIPKKSGDGGDPYQKQCLESARLIATELGWNDQRTTVAFQSRFGAAEWIKPYTVEVLTEMGKAGVGRVDVLCPGFATDCLETLEEIAIEGRDAFRKAGGKDFHYIPVTNDTPPWMTALSIIAIEQLENWR